MWRSEPASGQYLHPQHDDSHIYRKLVQWRRFGYHYWGIHGLQWLWRRFHGNGVISCRQQDQHSRSCLEFRANIWSGLDFGWCLCWIYILALDLCLFSGITGRGYGSADPKTTPPSKQCQRAVITLSADQQSHFSRHIYPPQSRHSIAICHSFDA